MSKAAKLQFSSHALWQFSLRYYPEVKDLCLRWQDRYHANVNIILALCYAERLSWQVDKEVLHHACLQLFPLNTQITRVLRLCRQQLPSLPLERIQQLQLKQSLLSTELMAEQLEQQLLCSELAFSAVAAPDNLTLYLQCLQLTKTTALEADIFDLRQASARIPLSSE